MKKPASLRAALVSAYPEFARNPDKLKLYITDGGIAARYSPDYLGYKYAYTLTILVMDYTGALDQLFFPLVFWVRANQPDILLNHDKADKLLKIEVDIIDEGTADIAVEVSLTESVDVSPQNDGSYRMSHRDEPAIAGTEGVDGRLPDGTVLLVTPYGELMLSTNGLILQPPS